MCEQGVSVQEVSIDGVLDRLMTATSAEGTHRTGMHSCLKN